MIWRPLRILSVTLSVSALCAASAHATPIIDFIDDTGAFTFSGITTAVTDPSDWYTFRGTAGTAITLETIAPTAHDTIIRLFRTMGAPAVAGNAVASFQLVEEDDDDGPGNLSVISRTLPFTDYYVVEVTGYFLSGNGAGPYQYRVTGDVEAVPTSTSEVPEPATVTLVIGGLAAAAVRRFKTRPISSEAPPLRGLSPRRTFRRSPPSP